MFSLINFGNLKYIYDQRNTSVQMDSTDLLHILQKEARKISNNDICLARAAVADSVQDLPEKYRKAYSSDYFAYMYAAFQELRACKASDKGEPVDAEEHRDLTVRISMQNDEGNVRQRAFSRFAAVVIPYLAFIAKRTIHPPGMIFPGGLMIIHQGNEYYCPVKNKHSGVELALCDFCKCRDSEELKGRREM
jgi:uncharacterized protein (UPF0305 family)